MTRFLARITRRRLAQSIAVALALPSAAPVLAQFRVEVSGVGLRQMPIALPAFHGEDGAPQKPAAIVQADLERSGLFHTVNASGQAPDETTVPDMAVWRERGADSLAAGSVQRQGDGH